MRRPSPLSPALWGVLIALAGCTGGGADGPAVDPTLDRGLAVDGAMTPDADPQDGAPPLDAGPDQDAAPAQDAAPPDASPPDAGPVDPTDGVFDPTRLSRIEITLDPADWDALRRQQRDAIDVRGADCLDAPFASPYTWFSAQVAIDGVAYDDVGVRKKGFFGSGSVSRPSLKLRFDKYVDDQAHQGVERMALNNNRQDPSRLHTCLAYARFAAAGLPAPRCALAQVFVNGEPMGVFSQTEELKKPFLRRHFADPDGHLYEGTLSDFRPEFRGTLEQKTDEDVPYFAPIDRLVAAAALPDAELIDGLAAVIDLDRFFTFWAMEVLTAHWDGYAGNTNNFYLYDDPTSGRLVFLPWGPDATFEAPWLLFERELAPPSIMATGVLARRLYLHPEGRARYLDRLQTLLDTAWDPLALLSQVDTWATLIAPALLPGNRAEHQAALGRLRSFIINQGERVAAELDRGGVDWDLPLRASLCQVEIGAAQMTFDTTWGSWPTDDTFATGDGTLSGELEGRPILPLDVGAAAGLAEDGGAVFILPAFFANRQLWFMYLGVPPDLITPGAYSLAEDGIACSLSRYDAQRGEGVEIARCLEGTLTFDAAERSAGAPVQGRLDVSLWGPLPPP